LNSVYAHGEQKSSASPSDAMASHSPRSPVSGRESHEPRVQLPYPEINRDLAPPAAPPIDIGTTLPRSLDDVMLAYTEIDEIFALYVCSLSHDQQDLHLSQIAIFNITPDISPFLTSNAQSPRTHFMTNRRSSSGLSSALEPVGIFAIPLF
jgi:hypothetical protein